MRQQTTLGSDLLNVIRAIVREEIANERHQLGTSGYSTRDLPPRTSARSFNETCRSGVVDGAIKEGRAWTCSREAWHRARGRKPVAAPRLHLVSDEPDVHALAERALRRARGSR